MLRAIRAPLSGAGLAQSPLASVRKGQYRALASLRALALLSLFSRNNRSSFHMRPANLFVALVVLRLKYA